MNAQLIWHLLKTIGHNKYLPFYNFINIYKLLQILLQIITNSCLYFRNYIHIKNIFICCQIMLQNYQILYIYKKKKKN